MRTFLSAGYLIDFKLLNWLKPFKLHYFYPFDVSWLVSDNNIYTSITAPLDWYDMTIRQRMCYMCHLAKELQYCVLFVDCQATTGFLSWGWLHNLVVILLSILL